MLAAVVLAFIFGVSAVKESGPQIVEIKNLPQESIVKISEIRPVNVLFVGDIMLDRKVEAQMQKNGFDYPFEKIKGFLNQSDFVFANLEGPVSKNPTNFSLNAMTFAFSDKVIAPLVSSNFRIFSLANNHTLNMYQKGLEETKALLDEAGIDWVGDPIICSDKYVLKNNLIFLAFNTTFSSCKDKDIIEIVEKTRKENPEKFLIISMHWGEEYRAEPSQAQKNLAHQIIDFGADLIIGHHPHVVGQIEEYKNKMIFYSLGNFIFDQYFSQETRQGLAVKLEIYKDKIIYHLFPVESIFSQPQLMEKEKSEALLKKQGFLPVIAVNNVEIRKVCFDKNCFYAEVVEKESDLALGMMFRKFLDESRGMLFVFSEYKNHPFWMKNTLIPLDIIWLDEDMRVVYIGENQEPCSEKICKVINPVEKSKYVLELNAGTAQKINLKIGDKLII